MLLIDTGMIPESHRLRTESKADAPRLWVLSSGVDAGWSCEYLLEFGYPVNAQGVFGQWVCTWQGSDDLEELVQAVKRLGLTGVRGVVCTP